MFEEVSKKLYSIGIDIHIEYPQPPGPEPFLRPPHVFPPIFYWLQIVFLFYSSHVVFVVDEFTFKIVSLFYCF